MTDTRHIHLITAAGKIRTAEYLGREHIVMPVTALVEGVLHAVNSPIPELVLSEEFSLSAQSWNGRPVMMNHPEIRGTKVSANHPRLLEESAFGHVFNTRVHDGKLTMEAWIDPERAKKIGGDALRTLERIQTADPKDPIEVSVGVFMVAEAAKGVRNGKPYKAVWRHITPDHLAILPEGKTGACSVAMGCGIRHAGVYLETAEGFEEVRAAGDTPGHGFYGNQHSQGNPAGSTGEKLQKAGFKRIDEGEKLPHVGVQKIDHVRPGHSVFVKEFDTEKEATKSSKGFDFYSHPGSTISDVHSPQASNSYYPKHVHSVEVKNPSSSKSIKAEVMLKPRREGRAPRKRDAEGHMSLWSRIKALTAGTQDPPTDEAIRAALSETESDADQRMALQEELKELEPESFGVSAIYSDRVVYGVMDPKGGNVTYYQRGYTGDEESGYKLDGTRTEVEQVTSFEPVTGDDEEEDGVTAAEGCKCHGGVDMTKLERIKALLAHPHNPLKDQKVLEGMPDEALKTLEEHATKLDDDQKAAQKVIDDAKAATAAADATAAAATTALKAAESKELTEDEFLKAAPASLRTMIERHKAADAKAHGTLVATLKTAQKVFTEETLKGKSLEQLQEIADLLQMPPVDFSLRAVPRAAADGTAEGDYKTQPPPDGYAMALEKRAAATKH